jgi:hypothetical protein
LSQKMATDVIDKRYETIATGGKRHRQNGQGIFVLHTSRTSEGCTTRLITSVSNWIAP